MSDFIHFAGIIFANALNPKKMKKTLKLFAMLTMASAMGIGLASCEKEPSTTTVEPAALTANDLAGTMWRCLFENSSVRQGVTMNTSLECRLSFMDTEKGEYYEKGVIELPDYPDYNQEVEMTYAFCYSVHDNKILVAIELTDDETGEVYIDEAEYTYDTDTDRIILDTDNPQMERSLGSDTYIFTRM